MANQSSRIEVKGLTETMFEIFNGGLIQIEKGGGSKLNPYFFGFFGGFL